MSRKMFTFACRSRVVFQVAFIACLFGVPPTSARAVEGPSAVVQQTADAVVAVLADKSLNVEQRRHRVEEIVYAHFDFET